MDDKEYAKEIQKIREDFENWKKYRKNRKAYIIKRIEELEGIIYEHKKNKR